MRMILEVYEISSGPDPVIHSKYYLTLGPSNRTNVCPSTFQPLEEIVIFTSFLFPIRIQVLRTCT